jgi:hypothetical protein
MILQALIAMIAGWIIGRKTPQIPGHVCHPGYSDALV